jgi:hypothetical protein
MKLVSNGDIVLMVKETDHSVVPCGDRLAKHPAEEEVPARVQSALWVTLGSLRRFALVDLR